MFCFGLCRGLAFKLQPGAVPLCGTELPWSLICKGFQKLLHIEIFTSLWNVGAPAGTWPLWPHRGMTVLLPTTLTLSSKQSLA